MFPFTRAGGGEQDSGPKYLFQLPDQEEFERERSLLLPVEDALSPKKHMLFSLILAHGTDSGSSFSLHLTSERPHKDDHRLHLLHILPSHDSSSRKCVGGVAYSQDSATASILQFCLNILSHIALLVLVSMSKYL